VPGFEYDLLVVSKADNRDALANWRIATKLKVDRAERIELGDVKLPGTHN
jgi:hypothetical protein